MVNIAREQEPQESSILVQCFMQKLYHATRNVQTCFSQYVTTYTAIPYGRFCSS